MGRAIATGAVVLAGVIAGCGGLQRSAAQIQPGWTTSQVAAAMGDPDDRQFHGSQEVWQYCKTGAGFGYHDYRMVWFKDGAVTGVSSYKSGRPATSCVRDFKPVRWEDAPDQVLEIRNR
ncbi:MAG: hypothetical protein AB1430_09175 [Pseudomonadota bacterium]